ncbi:MAG TPA: DUF721 domain-containing protein [Firmicutes bacterium]|nr:DUF721 domain-containing protein [Candidatus Fermentithermobacillaceae bacterium]
MRRSPYYSTGLARLSQVLEKSLDNMGLLTHTKRYQVFMVWPRVVGDIARHARPRRLDGDVLFVATASSVWSQELTFMKETILARLRAALGGDYVREIRFSEHLWEPAQDSRKPVRAFSADQVPWDGSVLEPISDEKLASSAKKFALAMARRRLYLLRRGYTHCSACGCLYPSFKKECPYCAVKRELRAKRKAIAILEKAPHLTDQEVMGLIGSQDLGAVKTARSELESRSIAIARSSKKDSQWRRGSRSIQDT